MINYTEKGYGQHLAVKAAGHWIKKSSNDGKYYCSDDVAVQAICDAYDPLPTTRSDAKLRINKQSSESIESILNQYPEFERLSWTDQESEARAYLIDNSVETPTLTPIATAKGMTVEDQCNRVILKADSYRALAASYIGERQRLNDLIDAETDWREIENIKFVAS